MKTTPSFFLLCTCLLSLPACGSDPETASESGSDSAEGETGEGTSGDTGEPAEACGATSPDVSHAGSSWTAYIDGGGEGLRDLVIQPQGGILVTGLGCETPSCADAWLHALDASGQTLWSSTFPENPDGALFYVDLAVGPDGSIAWARSELDTAAEESELGLITHIRRLDAGGSLEFSANFPGAMDSLAVDGDGAVWLSSAGTITDELEFADMTVTAWTEAGEPNLEFPTDVLASLLRDREGQLYTSQRLEEGEDLRRIVLTPVSTEGFGASAWERVYPADEAPFRMRAEDGAFFTHRGDRVERWDLDTLAWTQDLPGSFEYWDVDEEGRLLVVSEKSDASAALMVYDSDGSFLANETILTDLGPIVVRAAAWTPDGGVVVAGVFDCDGSESDAADRSFVRAYAPGTF